MPSWAWATLLSVLGLVGALAATLWRFGVGAGKVTLQMDLLGKTLEALGKDFREQSKLFTSSISSVEKQMTKLERRLIYMEARAEGQQPVSRNTPPHGVTRHGGSEDS